jgi:hypothetical protein
MFHNIVIGSSVRYFVTIWTWLSTCVGFEVFTAATMKNAVFWDVAPGGFIINQCFGGKHQVHLQGTGNNSSEVG